MVFLSAISFLACEPQTYFRSSLLSLVKLKPKKPDALAGYFIPNRQLYRCGSVKTKICNLLWIQRDSIFVLSSSSHRLVFDLNDLKKEQFIWVPMYLARKHQLRTLFFLRLFVEDGTTIIRPAVCRAFEVPSFLSSFNTPSIEVLIWPWESKPMSIRSLEPSALPTELILPR